MHEIDRLNRQIIDELSRNGRISNADLAEKIGLSASACLRRVQDLERKGIIRGYKAQINSEALGVGLVAFVMVGLSEHSTKAAQDFEDAVTASREVVEVHNVTGSIEYLIRVESQDLASFKRFHHEVLGTLPHVNSITSHICLESNKDERA